MIEVTVKTGKLRIDDEKIEHRYTGIIGAINKILHPFWSLFFNLEQTVYLKDIEKVTYKYGIPYVTKPRITIHYKGKSRIIAFKSLGEIVDYGGAKSNLEKVIEDLRKKGIEVEEDK